MQKVLKIKADDAASKGKFLHNQGNNNPGRFSGNFMSRHALIWLIGWFSLGLTEIVLRFTITPPPLPVVILLTLFIYALAGSVLGSFYGGISYAAERLWHRLKRQDTATHVSMSACIALIFFTYALLFFLQYGLHQNTPMRLFKSMILFVLSLTILFLLPFFFSRMDRKGKLFIAYSSLLPALWVITSLRLNRNRELFPSLLQITTLSRTLLLAGSSLLCFFLLYLLFSLGRKTVTRLKAASHLKAGILILSSLIFFMLVLLSLKGRESAGTLPEKKNAPKDKSNVLLITLDTTRVDHLSCYGYGKPTTPNLDSFAREGTLYRNAYATASWTTPSHASIFTGKYPAKHGAHYDPDFMKILEYLVENQKEHQFKMENLVEASILPLGTENITLAEVLSERGYRTAGIIGGYMCSSTFGLSQGFDYYNESFFPIGKDLKIPLICQTAELFFSLNDFFTYYGYSSGERIASDVNKAALQWLEKNYQEPFFLFINYFDPHGPHLPRSPYDQLFGKTDKSIIKKWNAGGNHYQSYIQAEWDLAMAVRGGHHLLTPDEKEVLIARYDGEIRYVDYHLGLLLEKLKKLEIFDNTLIIITADHGEAFGEHNFMYHKSALYEEIVHVPLIIKYPRSSRQMTVEKRVSLVDLMPTVLACLDYPIPAGIDGEVLEETRHAVIAEDYASWWQFIKVPRNLRAVFEGDYKLIWASDAQHELYDIVTDPGEEKNLLKKFPQRAETMERTLTLWLASFTPPRKSTGAKLKIDEKTVEAIRTLGYIR